MAAVARRLGPIIPLHMLADVDVQPVIAKARRRLIPFLFLLYIVAYLDRINVGFASLQMNEALGFSATVYGFGAGIFFIGYTLFEVPSNVLLARVGARRWVARIMISWGLVSCAMMFVASAGMFYTLRFLLGVAEAGFFPGIIFYLTRWFPSRERARTVAAFMTATLAAGIIGGPISGALLTLNGFGGLAGWQWVFLLEGLPAVVLGFVVLRTLTERPHDATWLTTAERAALIRRLEEDGATTIESDTSKALRARRTWLLAVVYFTIPVSSYGIGFWLPQMLKSASGASTLTIGLLSAIPYVVGATAMIVVGRHSDRTGERRWHVLIAALVSAAGLGLATIGTGTAWTVFSLSIATLGYASRYGPTKPPVLPIEFTSAIAAAAYLLGAVNDATHSFAAGLWVIAAILVLGGSVVLFVPEK